MQVALKPGQQVPQHNANSNVHLLIVEGQIIVTLDGKDTVATKGDILPVTFKTLMWKGMASCFLSRANSDGQTKKPPEAPLFSEAPGGPASLSVP